MPNIDASPMARDVRLIREAIVDGGSGGDSGSSVGIFFVNLTEDSETLEYVSDKNAEEIFSEYISGMFPIAIVTYYDGETLQGLNAYMPVYLSGEICVFSHTDLTTEPTTTVVDKFTIDGEGNVVANQITIENQGV